MRAILYIFFVLFANQLLAGDPVLEKMDLSFAGTKNVRGIKVWKVNTIDHDDQHMVEVVNYKDDGKVDRVKEMIIADDGGIKSKYSQIYIYNNLGLLEDIVCKKDGVPYKSIRQFYNGKTKIRQVHFQTKTSFDYVEGYDYYPNGKVMRTYTNEVPAKLMMSKLHKYQEDGKLEQVMVKRNKLTIENWFYTHTDNVERIIIQDVASNDIGSITTVYRPDGQVLSVEHALLNKYEKIEYEYYQNNLVKLIKRYNSPNRPAKFYYELEYEFFD